MERIEMVEALVKKAGIAYEEARQVLERNGWDLVNAMVELEKAGKLGEGKVEKPQGGKAHEKAEGLLSRLISWLKKVIDLGNRNHFTVTRNNERVLTVPVTVAAIMLMVLNGFFLLALLVGLIAGYRYGFLGEKEQAQDKQAVAEADRAAEDLTAGHMVNSFDVG